jgi:hypothetical protein
MGSARRAYSVGYLLLAILCSSGVYGQRDCLPHKELHEKGDEGELGLDTCFESDLHQCSGEHLKVLIRVS